MFVNYELLQKGCQRAREITLMRNRNREATPERKAQHKKWAHSERGRISTRERSRRYREAHPERVKAKRDRFYAKLKRTPEIKERYYRRNKQWREDFYERNGYTKSWWYRTMKKAVIMSGEHTLFFIGGCIKVNMGRAA